MDRKEAIKTLQELWRETNDSWYEEVYNMAIEALKAQAWIPCNEKLPRRDEFVLVSFKTTDKIHLCKYLDDDSENPWWSYIDDCCAWNNVITAWMPLPDPYKPESDGE